MISLSVFGEFVQGDVQCGGSTLASVRSQSAYDLMFIPKK